MTRRNILSITSKAMTVCSIPDSLIRLFSAMPRAALGVATMRLDDVGRLRPVLGCGSQPF